MEANTNEILERIAYALEGMANEMTATNVVLEKIEQRLATMPVGGGSGGPRSGHKLVFGKAKGKPIEEGTDGDLEYHLGVLAKSIADPTKGQYRENNEKLHSAIRKELARRGGKPVDAGGGEAKESAPARQSSTFRGGVAPSAPAIEDIPF